MPSTEHTNVIDENKVEVMLRRTRMGYHRAVTAVGSVGNDVIMDYRLSEPRRLDDLVARVAGPEPTAPPRVSGTLRAAGGPSRG